MKLHIAILLFLSIGSCRNQSETGTVKFSRRIPDTSKTWAGQMTRDAFIRTRVFEKELELKSIIDGAANEEIRVWNLSGSYDPQDLFIVKADSLGKWTLQTISIFPSKRDNMYIEYSQLLRQSSADSLKLNELWYIKSQSEVSNGDTYGCMDGVDVLIETANVLNYRLMWYRCPMINKGKDSVFRSIAELIDNLEAFASER